LLEAYLASIGWIQLTIIEKTKKWKACTAKALIESIELLARCYNGEVLLFGVLQQVEVVRSARALGGVGREVAAAATEEEIDHAA
jgi:hypothetical protein